MLCKSPGWVRLCEILKTQIRLRKAALETEAVKSLDSAFSLSYAQGEVAGIRLVMALPEMLIEDLEEEMSGNAESGADS